MPIPETNSGHSPSSDAARLPVKISPSPGPPFQLRRLPPQSLSHGQRKLKLLAAPTVRISRSSARGAPNEMSSIFRQPPTPSQRSSPLRHRAPSSHRPSLAAWPLFAMPTNSPAMNHRPTPKQYEQHCVASAGRRDRTRTQGTYHRRTYARWRPPHPIRWQGCETAHCSCWGSPARFVAPN